VEVPYEANLCASKIVAFQHGQLFPVMENIHKDLNISCSGTDCDRNPQCQVFSIFNNSGYIINSSIQYLVMKRTTCGNYYESAHLSILQLIKIELGKQGIKFFPPLWL
jgi:hypothetical protein